MCLVGRYIYMYLFWRLVATDLELLVGSFEKLNLLSMLLLIDLSLLGGRSLRLLELQLQFVELSLQVFLVPLHLLNLHRRTTSHCVHRPVANYP